MVSAYVNLTIYYTILLLVIKNFQIWLIITFIIVAVIRRIIVIIIHRKFLIFIPLVEVLFLIVFLIFHIIHRRLLTSDIFQLLRIILFIILINPFRINLHMSLIIWLNLINLYRILLSMIFLFRNLVPFRLRIFL